MGPRRLAEVVLLVGDIDRSVAFYRDHLGLTVISPDGAPATFLRIGPAASGVPQQIVLIPRPPGARPATTDRLARDVHHIGLEVDPGDWDGERRRLAGLGHAIRDGEHPFLPLRAFYLDDPDGNEIEVVATAA